MYMLKCGMAVDNQDQEINKLLNALGFEKSVCHIRQNMVAALELTKNACLDSEFSCIYTGSLAEGFSGNYYSKISRADFDFMFIFNRFPYIVDEDKTRDDAPKLPLVARVCHDSVRQGYAKLELITVKVPSKSHLAVKFEDRLFLSSLKTLSSLMRINRKLLGFIREEEVLDGVQFERHGPASSVTIESKEEGYAKRDLVYGHRCQFWPKCAQNWITRRRNWPENADVINAAKLGCHLVPTGFPGSKTEELEWRYSFVKPERHIMWLFNDCQRKCFALLKILNKENLASHFDTDVLTSYHFKTTLLWVLEETDDPDWSDKDLLKHVKTCLVKLMTFIKSRHCPHYFIEHANLFDREIFKDETCGKLSKILDSVLEDPYTALRSCPTFQTLINDVTFIDFDFLHQCHLSFQWFLMCYRQLDELVSVSGGFFWKTTLKHYDTHNKKLAFIVKNRQNLKAMADNPLHELFSRPFVRVNHTFLGILKHIEITINKINPDDEEEVEILNLFVDDARKNFEKGSKGIDVGSKLRLANFEFMMKEYERVENILKDVVHVFEHNLYGRDEELLTTARDLENIFIQFISNLLKGQSISHEETHAKHKNIIERAYKCGLAQGLFENLGEHIHPLIDMEKNFLEFISKKWLLTEVILFPDEIDCVPFPIQLELAVLKISSSVENFLFYHPEIFALALRCLVSLSQNNLRTAQIFCDEMSSSLQRIQQKYHVQTLNLIGHLSLRIGNLDDAWRSFSEACRLPDTGESSVWFLALLLLKKFKN